MDGDARQPGLEENFRRLEEIVARLEDDSLPLEEAFCAYSHSLS